jgi:sugar phosphate isomerase/epimerase
MSARTLDRRGFLRSALGGAALAALPACAGASVQRPGARMRLGLVTYLWARDWDLGTLLRNCEASGVLGVELRTTHAHGVEPVLDAAARRAVRARFDDSPVAMVGLGSNEAFHHAQQGQLARAIATTKAFVQLSHDVGGSGVKVKPDGFVAGVPRERTIAQIGSALRDVARFADGLGQEVRLEVHGAGTSELPQIRAIMQAAGHPRAVVCWNSNAEDLQGAGLVANFDLVKPWLGATAHVRELDAGDYPYAELFACLVRIDYAGWILLEARRDPREPIAALRAQKAQFQSLVARAQSA